MGDLISDKKCSLCGERKPAAAFGIKKAKGNKAARLNSWCKRCVADRTAAYNAKHPDERRSRDQAYYERTKDQRRAYRERYGHEYNKREAVKNIRRRHHQSLKRRCFEAYKTGREIACECCNENILDFLTLDHKNNDGKAHREALGGRTNGPRFYKWLEDHGYPQNLGLRILCLNCNWARHWNNGICPHQEQRLRLAA